MEILLLFVLLFFSEAKLYVYLMRLVCVCVCVYVLINEIGYLGKVI